MRDYTRPDTQNQAFIASCNMQGRTCTANVQESLHLSLEVCLTNLISLFSVSHNPTRSFSEGSKQAKDEIISFVIAESTEGKVMLLSVSAIRDLGCTNAEYKRGYICGETRNIFTPQVSGNDGRGWYSLKAPINPNHCTRNIVLERFCSKKSGLLFMFVPLSSPDFPKGINKSTCSLLHRSTLMFSNEFLITFLLSLFGWFSFISFLKLMVSYLSVNFIYLIEFINIYS